MPFTASPAIRRTVSLLKPERYASVARQSPLTMDWASTPRSAFTVSSGSITTKSGVRLMSDRRNILPRSSNTLAQARDSAPEPATVGTATMGGRCRFRSLPRPAICRIVRLLFAVRAAAAFTMSMLCQSPRTTKQSQIFCIQARAMPSPSSSVGSSGRSSQRAYSILLSSIFRRIRSRQGAASAPRTIIGFLSRLDRRIWAVENTEPAPSSADCSGLLPRRRTRMPACRSRHPAVTIRLIRIAPLNIDFHFFPSTGYCAQYENDMVIIA